MLGRSGGEPFYLPQGWTVLYLLQNRPDWVGRKGKVVHYHIGLHEGELYYLYIIVFDEMSQLWVLSTEHCSVGNP